MGDIQLSLKEVSPRKINGKVIATARKNPEAAFIAGLANCLERHWV